MEQLMTKKDVMKLLKISAVTVDRERKRGNLAFTKLGNSIRFTQQMIKDYVLKNSNGVEK